MGKYYKRKSTRGHYGEERLSQALTEIASGSSMRGASLKFGVPRRTLQRHSKQQVLKPGKQHLGRSGIFPLEVENQLAEKLIDLQRRFYGMTLDDLQHSAYQMAERMDLPHPFRKESKKVGRGWVRGFLERHPELSVRAPEPTSMSRAVGFNLPQVKRFFDLYEEVLRDTGAGPSQIFNMDESGITSVHKPPRIVGKKGQKQMGKITSGERGQTVTIVCCMNAVGTYIPPFLIFPRKRMNDLLMNDTPFGSVGVVSDSGWTSSEIFLQWLQHFIDHVKPGEEKKMILLLDGHSSHKSLAAVVMARENHVSLVCLPPHTSHKLQPLDLSFFGPLKSAYSSECDKWMLSHPGQRITFYQMGGLFGRAYNRVATIDKAVSGFRAAGCSPFNPDIFSDDDFAPALLTDEAQPDVNNNLALNDGELHAVTFMIEYICFVSRSSEFGKRRCCGC